MSTTGTQSKGNALVADIGATRARFARVEGPEGVLEDRVELATGDYSDSADLVRDALQSLRVSRLTACSLAVAGPVKDGIVTITNGGLHFSDTELVSRFGCPVRLVNDFYALARSLNRLSQLQRLGGQETDERAVKAVIGPGSGLGMSLLVPLGEGWHVLPSEGGHADLAATNHLEQEILTLLLESHGSVCWETVLSGPGLVNLYRVVARLWGAEPKALTPESVSRLGVDAEDPVCHQTLETFFGWLGAAAGNLALTVGATGGVYIGGGIVPTLTEFAQSSPLRRRFEERCEVQDYMRDIPLYLILDPDPGLLGAQACLDEIVESAGC